MNKCFFNEHPFISLLMLTTVCETSIIITKIIKGKQIREVNLFGINFGDEPSEPKDANTNKENEEIKKEG